MVQCGMIRDEVAAFKQYLGDGKRADVQQLWPDLPQTIAWIRNAGGIAVLAHPLKYRLSRSRIWRLSMDFAGAGGEAIEVINGHQSPEKTTEVAKIAVELGLLGSGGSDFHGPEYRWQHLGVSSPMPANVPHVLHHLGYAGDF